MTIVTSKDLSDGFVRDQEARHQNPDAFRGYRFNMPWFMKRTGGWGRDWLCFVYGQAGIGKTSVLTTAAAQLGRDKVPFLYVALEETLFTVAQRIFTNLEDISRVKFRDITLEQSDWPNVYQAAKTMSEFPAYWTDDLYTDKELIDAIKAVKPKVLLVDYLQLLVMPGRTMTEQVAAGSKLLKRIAKGQYTNKEPICVIAAAQLNDDGNVLGSRDPQRDADLIVEISNLDDGAGGTLPGKKRFKIRKSRHGEEDATTIAFFGKRSMVGEIVQAHTGPIPVP